jgi:hypothetical protein
VNYTVKICHLRCSCPKIATKSLQLSIKMKKRTPPTPHRHSSLTSCSTNINTQPVCCRLQFAGFTLPYRAGNAKSPPGQCRANFKNRRNEPNLPCPALPSNQLPYMQVMPISICLQGAQKIEKTNPTFGIFLAYIRLAHFTMGSLLSAKYNLLHYNKVRR